MITTARQLLRTSGIMSKIKVLFLIRKPETPYNYSYPDTPYSTPYGYNSSGLYNSANMVVTMLNQTGHVDAKLVQVIDSNDIDREVAQFNPAFVFVEAFWVPPYKFAELLKLHPAVKFVVRCHSKPPFLAMEGIAFSWLLQYAQMGIPVAANSADTADDLYYLLEACGLNRNLSQYLPNYYVTTQDIAPIKEGTFNIGCFGAIRPLKNQINQALAAVEFGNNSQMKIAFHINGSRVETQGNPVLKSLQAIFAQTPNAQLVTHPWYDHDQFLQVVKTMDVVMQVSYTETFNIVCADAVNCSVPVVCSKEMTWLTPQNFVDYNDVGAMVVALHNISIMDEAALATLLQNQMAGLRQFNTAAKQTWLDYIGA